MCKKMDETREDSLTKHATSGIYDVVCAKHIQPLFFVLALMYYVVTDRPIVGAVWGAAQTAPHTR